MFAEVDCLENLVVVDVRKVREVQKSTCRCAILFCARALFIKLLKHLSTKTQRSVLVQPSARIIIVPLKNLVTVNLVTWAVMASKPFCLQSLITYKATRAAFYPNAKLIIPHGLLCLLVNVLLY